MPNNFEVLGLEQGIDDFASSIDSINVDKIEKKTLKKAAHELSEMVRQAVVAEDDITSPAMNGPYERGPGPSMATGDAWLVKESGDSYTVEPHPQVEQRAVVLNYGYPGEITPNNSEVLKFEVNGVPVFADSVSGPDYTGYWQAAMRRFRNSGKLKRIAESELEKEFEENI